MKKIKNNKAAGTERIHPELIKYRRIKLLNRMYELVRQIWKAERIPEEWKETLIVSTYKNEVEMCVRMKGE
jgi:hypothetical protein